MVPHGDDLGVVQGENVDAPDKDPARRQPVKRANYVQECGLAAARRLTIATNLPFFIDRFIPRSATTLPAADSNTLTTFSTFMTVESPLLLLLLLLLPPFQHCPLCRSFFA
jgi:hypothetical protein